MTEDEEPELGFVFDLHMLCGGYAYYSTLSLWTRRAESGREMRKPRLVSADGFDHDLLQLGVHARHLRSESEYEHWLFRRGWAFVPKSLAFSVMPQWLKEHECTSDGVGTYTALNLVAQGAIGERISPHKREKVLERDGRTCLRCGRTEADVELTMQHVTPRCYGGEGTSRNLVTLCKPCNGEVGTARIEAFYEMAGLPHSYDLGLVRAEFTGDALMAAIKFSSNMMHARCEVY